MSVTVAQGVEHHFDTAGDSELVEDAEEIILHSVFGELETVSDFPIAKPLGHTSHYIVSLRGGKANRCAPESGEAGLRQSFQDELQLTAVGPDLSRMYAMNALGEQANGFGSAENTLRAGTKGFDQVERSDESSRTITRVPGT